MTAPIDTIAPEPAAARRVPAETLAGLLQAPVAPAAGRKLLAIFKDLNGEASDGEAARLYRQAYFVLDNLGYADAENYAENRSLYSNWFYGQRKRLMDSFMESAEALQPGATPAAA